MDERGHRHAGWSCRSLLLLEQTKRTYVGIEDAAGPEEVVNRLLSTIAMAVQVGIVLAQEHPAEAAELLAELRQSDRLPGTDAEQAGQLASANGVPDPGQPLNAGVVVDAATGRVVVIASQDAVVRWLEQITGQPVPEPHATSGPGGERTVRPGVIDISVPPGEAVEEAGGITLDLTREQMRKARWN